MFVMGFIVSGGMVNGQGCVFMPFACFAGSLSCGFDKCYTGYSLCENEAVEACEACDASCNPPDCDKTTICYTPKVARTAQCKTAAEAIFNNMLDSGTFSNAQCNEMDSCILSVRSLLKDAVKIIQCQNDINLDSKFKVIKDFIGRESEILDGMDMTKWSHSINQHGNAFKFPDTELGASKFAEGLKDSLLTQEVYASQSEAIKAQFIVRDAVAIANENGLLYVTEPSVLNKFINFFGIPQSLEEIPGNIIKMALGAGINKLIESVLKGDEESDEDDEPAAQASRNIAQSCTPSSVQNSYISYCNDERVPQDVGKPNCFREGILTATQSYTQVPSSSQVCSASIHVIDKKNNNMYTINGDGNLGVIFKDGFFDIHDFGWTQIDVAGKGAFITDQKNNMLYIGKGTSTYLGIGSEDKDVYIGNNLLFHINYLASFRATKDKDGDAFHKFGSNGITGKATYKPSEGKLAVSFNHFSKPNYENAVDLSNTGGGYQILTGGFANIVLVGDNKFFPMFSRNVLKGDSSIVSNRNVKVLSTYISRDIIYDYTIKSDSSSTKVFAANDKVIEDSGPLNYKLSKRQSLLIYNI